MTTNNKHSLFKEILDKYERPLLRYVRQMVAGRLEKAQEIVQETFLKLWKEEFREIQTYCPQWLYRVARNQAIDEYRKERQMKKHILQQNDQGAALPLQLAEELMQKNDVLKAVASLPAKAREAVILKFQEGLSYAEIGSVMGISISHVGVLIHQGVQILRKALAAGGGQ
ncbi:MAG: sigma-70 family RNA polymerase sigma factor [Pseudomonadota bacterium]